MNENSKIVFLLCFFVFSFVPSFVQAQNPTYCSLYRPRRFDCNCHSCNCQTCYSCGCSVKRLFWEDCDYGLCTGNNDCWCSPFCKCCRDGPCAYSCNCQTCCDSCYETECAAWVQYTVTGIDPRRGNVRGGDIITIQGGIFSRTNNTLCRFSSGSSSVLVSAVFVSDIKLRCITPPFSAGSAFVEVSMDGGQQFTRNNVTFTYYQCPRSPSGEDCSGHGNCNLDGSCTCRNGYYGNACDSACPGGANNPCTSHGLVKGNCNSDGTCSCEVGYWGTACDRTCPGGVGNNTCSGHGLCLSDGTCLCNNGFVGANCSYSGICNNVTNQCECRERGYWGPNCENICPGGVSNPCNDHGNCTNNGQCLCNVGYYGSLCENECPGGPSNPCSNHSRLETCGVDGTCECREGYYGNRCENECPGGANSPCSTHGVCNINGVCTCQTGWVGTACEIECAGGANNPCNMRGTCRADLGGNCTCNDGYYGTQCEGVCPSTLNGICNNHGICNEGQCSCLRGYFGPSCSGECPGSAATPCSNVGLCNITTGICECLIGYFGDACQFQCPGGASHPCSGNGTCNSNGTCSCNPTYRGVDCSERYCPYNCYNHSLSCINGVCICSPQWSGVYCSEYIVPVVNTSVSHGVLQFAQDQFTVREDIASIVLTVTRDDGASGSISALIVPVNISALSGIDFKLKNGLLVWKDGDSSPKTATILIIDDKITEGPEVFKVVIGNVTGGAEIGNLSTIFVTIVDPVGDILTITIRMIFDIKNITEGSIERTQFVDTLRHDISIALSIPEWRVLIQGIKADTSESIKGDDNAIFVSIQFVESSDHNDKNPSELNHALVELISKPNSTIYLGRISQYIDIAFFPIITSSSPHSPGDTHDSSRSKLALIISVSVICAVLIICFVLCYVYRKPLVDWLLWKLGGFRFNRFRDSEKTTPPTKPPTDELALNPGDSTSVKEDSLVHDGTALDDMPIASRDL